MTISFDLALSVVFCLALIWLAWLVLIVISKFFTSPKNHKKSIFPYASFGILAVGIFFLRFPYYSAMYGAVLPTGDVACLSLLDVLRYFSMSTDFELMDAALITFHSSTAWRFLPAWSTSPTVYQAVDIVMLVAAPVCTLSAIFSLFRAFFKRIGLFVLAYRKVYYFSSLNEKSYTMAESLYADWRRRWFFTPKEGMTIQDHWFFKRKPALVFCQVDSGDSNDTEVQFRADAEALGAVFYPDPIHSIRLVSPRWRTVDIFLMDSNEDANILSLLKMKEKLIAKRKCDRNKKAKPNIPHSDIYVFSTHESTQLLFDNLLEEFSGAADCDRNYCLHLIDETELIVQNLLMEHPLYEPLMYIPKSSVPIPPGQQDPASLISVLAIGGGLLGMELVRAAMLCGITNNYQFEVQIIDQNADVLERQFQHFAPYLQRQTAGKDIHIPEIIQGEDGIGTSIIPKFLKADCRSIEFDQVLKEHCANSNYIVIATGDDELNISTARFLQRWYARQDILRGEVPSRPPMIFAAIRNTERHEALLSLELDKDTLQKSKQLFLFASNQELFCPKGILNRPLDASAALFNECYNGGSMLKVNSLCKPPEHRQSMLYALFKLPQVMRFSNQIVALHSLYKLQGLMYSTDTPYALLKYREKADRTVDDTRQLLGKLAQLVKAGGESLHRLEHHRWNLFQILDGWETFPMDMIPACLEANYIKNKRKPHQIPKIKLHGCLVLFDELTELGRICGKDPDEFKLYDACMCCASLFAWLDLEADPHHAEVIREELLALAKKKLGSDTPCCSYETLLDLIIDTYAPQQSAVSA